MRTTEAWDRLCMAAGVAGLLAFAVAAFTPIAAPLDRWMASAPDAGQADAVVVLGSDVDPDGRLPEDSLRRAAEAVALYHEGRAPLVLMLGSRNGAASEAASRVRLAQGLGVPASALLTEPRGLTTAVEAQRSAELLLPRGARRILLVTGEHRIWRARRLFERAGFEVLAAPVPEGSPSSNTPGERLSAIGRLLQELAARALARLSGKLDGEPDAQLDAKLDGKE
ncbi:YdcF family protein [Sorangium sp. So ce1097]|uniref:YdcF family protein n=1 Tax=Sorangium sp. So ce1097 TaxID=3133330 RepID=UPI003F61A96F